MATLAPQICALTVSNHGLEYEIQSLKQHMQGLQPGSPEDIYDQLNLELEERRLQIRKENPDLDPTSQDGDAALSRIMGRDPECQRLNHEIREMTEAYSSECTKWGIPMASGSDVKDIPISEQEAREVAQNYAKTH